MLSSEECDKAVQTALSASKIAAGIINFALEQKDSKSVIFEEKTSSADVVTEWDRRCEREVINYLRAATPTYAILSEETQNKTVITSRPTWVVDPIDGTMSFVHGMYDCCVSIALLVNREPVVGVVNAPQLNQVFWATKGRGAYCNNKKISVSGTTTLKRALVLSHYSSHRTEESMSSTAAIHKDLNLYPVHCVRVHGSSALDMCLVACGKADVYFDAGPNPWDIAAGTIIVKEAGGVVHDVDHTDSFSIDTRGICCGNSEKLTAMVVELVRKYGYRQAVQNRSKL